MRRISLAVALMSAVAAAGCSGGAKSTSDAGGAQGVAGSTFTVTVKNPGTAGYVESGTLSGTTFTVDGKIKCGSTFTACKADYNWNPTAPVVLRAVVVATNYFNGWAGDCFGRDYCTLSNNAEKYVVADFSATPQSHPNFSSPADHAAAWAEGTLKCLTCHGANGQGAGIAVACTSCHTDGAPPQPVVPTSTGLQVIVNSVTVDGTAKTFTLNFTLKDTAGAPVDLKGVYSKQQNMDGTLRVALSRIDTDASGKVLPYAVLTPATGSPGTLTMPLVGAAAGTSGQLVEVGTNAGTYSFTSPALAKIDATKLTNTHTLWIQATRQANLTNAFDPKNYAVVNKEFNFDATTGASVAAKREITSTAACNKCHNGFKAEANATGTAWASFHSGARVEGPFCGVCHNPGRTSNPAADAMVFVHRVHGAHQTELPAALQFHGIAVTYPQDVRNCTECHEGAQADQYKTRPTRAACGSCHYAVSFVNPIPTDWPAAGVTATLHTGGAQADDSLCAGCHSATSIVSKHTAVVAKDPNNSLDGGTNIRTNAGAMPAAGMLPAGAAKIQYVISSVEAFNDTTVTPNVLRPRITFKFTKDGSNVTFNAQPATPPADKAGIVQLMNGFVGAPSVYFVWSEPQDGVTAPADFNKSASANLLAVQNKKVTGATITGPDASGFYTVTLGGSTIPATAKMLTGGVGFSYDYPTAAEFALGTIKNQPLTQIDLAAYPYDSTKGSGGLVVTAPNVSMVAAGYTARRAVVDNAKCNQCHGALGVAPSFHVGQRNDGPTCSWCHNPNRTSSQWSANASTFIHGIHGAKKRSVPFNWHAGACPTGTTFTANTTGDLNTGVCKDNVSGAVVEPSPFYPEVEYPGSGCTQCHVSGSFDFSAAASAAALPNLLWTTAATGTPAVSISTSPYVTIGTNYGSNNTALTSLVTSPITAACFSCHDTAGAQSHMTAFGGKIYQARSAVGGATLSTNETCLSCHASGIVGINTVHQ